LILSLRIKCTESGICFLFRYSVESPDRRSLTHFERPRILHPIPTLTPSGKVNPLHSESPSHQRCTRQSVVFRHEYFMHDVVVFEYLRGYRCLREGQTQSSTESDLGLETAYAGQRRRRLSPLQ